LGGQMVRVEGLLWVLRHERRGYDGAQPDRR
jgi:hypothetical protein